MFVCIFSIGCEFLCMGFNHTYVKKRPRFLLCLGLTLYLAPSFFPSVFFCSSSYVHALAVFLAFVYFSFSTLSTLSSIVQSFTQVSRDMKSPMQFYAFVLYCSSALYTSRLKLLSVSISREFLMLCQAAFPPGYRYRH